MNFITYQVIMLDDLGVNLKAAKALGMDTIKVTSEEQGLQELSQKLNLDLLHVTHRSKL